MPKPTTPDRLAAAVEHLHWQWVEQRGSDELSEEMCQAIARALLPATRRLLAGRPRTTRTAS